MIHLDMGRYAGFVWPAYGISLLVIGWLVIDSLRRSARWRREVERLSQEKEPS